MVPAGEVVLNQERAVVAKRFRFDVEIDEIMMSFDQAGMIKTETMGNQIIYVMPDNMVNELKKLYAGKQK